MGLWRFVIAQGVDEEDATAETQAFLDSVQLGDLQDAAIWKKPDHTRPGLARRPTSFRSGARYAPRIKGETNSADMPTIGVNYLSADRPLWFTLADCVASKLLTGKAPKVVRAIRFTAKTASRWSCGRIEIAGEAEFRVNPYKDDFYKRVIELRRRVKADFKEAERRDPQQPGDQEPGHEPARAEDPRQRHELRDLH